MCTLSDFWQQWVDASEWWLNIFCREKKWRKEVKGQLGTSKHCCHSNRSSCSFMMHFLPIGLTRQWHRQSWWCVMFPRRWNSLESCDGLWAFLSFQKSPGSKSRGMLGYTVLKSTTGSPHFSWGFDIRLYLSVGNDKPQKTNCSYTSNSQSFFLFHTSKQFAFYIKRNN